MMRQIEKKDKELDCNVYNCGEKVCMGYNL